MVPITANFQRERPLHPEAAALLERIFERGWADPAKLHLESRRAAILLQEAKESLAGHLGLTPDELYFLGEPALGFHLGITGLLSPESTLIYSGIDRQEVMAVAASHEQAGGHSQKLRVGLLGEVEAFQSAPTDVLAWQLANGETGILRTQFPRGQYGQIFCDATTSGALVALPEGWKSALWEATAWGGPAGIGIFGLAENAIWRNPIPHLDGRRVPGGFSLPLALASSVALDHHMAEISTAAKKLQGINQEIRNFVATEIGECDIAGTISNTNPEILSLSFLYIDAERLLTELDAAGFAVDSGSACSSMNLTPSHVLAEMGLLTGGNIRLRLNADIEPTAIAEFLKTLQVKVAALRS